MDKDCLKKVAKATKLIEALAGLSEEIGECATASAERLLALSAENKGLISALEKESQRLEAVRDELERRREDCEAQVSENAALANQLASARAEIKKLTADGSLLSSQLTSVTSERDSWRSKYESIVAIHRNVTVLMDKGLADESVKISRRIATGG